MRTFPRSSSCFPPVRNSSFRFVSNRPMLAVLLWFRGTISLATLFPLSGTATLNLLVAIFNQLFRSAPPHYEALTTGRGEKFLGDLTLTGPARPREKPPTASIKTGPRAYGGCLYRLYAGCELFIKRTGWPNEKSMSPFREDAESHPTPTSDSSLGLDPRNSSFVGSFCHACHAHDPCCGRRRPRLRRQAMSILLFPTRI